MKTEEKLKLARSALEKIAAKRKHTVLYHDYLAMQAEAAQALADIASQDTAPPAAVPAPGKLEAFEKWARSHGGLSLESRSSMECENGWFPATYWSAMTEIAWRAFANAPASHHAAAPAQAVDALTPERIRDLAITHGVIAFHEDPKLTAFAHAVVRAALAAQPAALIPVRPDHQKDDHERMMTTLSREPSPEAQAFYDELLGKPAAPAGESVAQKGTIS